MRRFGLALLISGFLVAAAPPQDGRSSAISGYGGTNTPAGARERPDRTIHYRVLFNVTKGAAAPGDVNPALNKVARFLNLLADDASIPRRATWSRSSMATPRPRP